MKKLTTVLLLLAALMMVVPVSSQGPADLTAVGAPTAGSSVEPAAGKDAGERSALPLTAGFTPSEFEPVSIIVTYDDSVDASTLQSVSGGQIVHSYSKVFNGASLVLPGGKVDDVAAIPGITGVYLDELVQVDTDASPEFIGAPAAWEALGGQENAGEGIVVGVLDTGIWPEHPSFADPDPAGNAYPEPPGGPYPCYFGNTAWNPNDVPFECNNKLIGAYQFLDTYKAVVGLAPVEFDSARDSNGHGSHTSSTAAGNAGVEASILGTSFGEVSGIAPRAHIIMYRVCGEEGCYYSDSTAAVEQAILDGVDVINFSIGGGSNPYTDIVSLAFLSAYQNGVFVACSAGNSGPGADTVGHREPWVTTVAASTQSRSFEGQVYVEADNGDTLELVGVSIGGSITGELVIGADYGDALCGSVDGVNPFAPGTFTSDQIVVCRRGNTARVEKSYNVMEAGGGGVILYNPAIQTLNADNHFIPTVHIDDVSGIALLDFMAAHTGEMASLQGGVKVFGQGDVMAAFSSRGGPGQTLGISKPDISAPGVNILAAQTPMPDFPFLGAGAPGQYFQAIGGTSMASPHIAGSAALLKDLHPDWTPGQIKSALMMTALTDGLVKEDGVTPADPFDIGSGRIDLSVAGFAELTISDSAQSFVDLENELWNANYPSLYVPVMPGQITVQRTVHNETNLPRNWKLTPKSTPDVTIIVPGHIQVPANGDATFDITVDARNVPLGEVRHATIEFKQGNEDLHFPVTIVRQQPAIVLTKSCEPAQFSLGSTTECRIAVGNSSYDRAQVVVEDQLPDGLSLIGDTLVGAHTKGKNGLAFTGWLEGATPGLRLDDTVPLYGYIPLSAYGFTPIPPPSSNPDDGGYGITGLDFWYQNVHYTTAIWSVNGTLEIGTASGYTASASNKLMPDPTIPNNLLAAWWTDLDLSLAGEWYMGALSDGVNVYDIFEWANVPRFGDPASTATFQIWLMRGTNLAWFTYGGFVGDVSDGTIGVENADGTIGDTYYYGEGGVGTLPTGDLHVDQNSGALGEAHIITFTATGVAKGPWQNCAEMTSDLFFGTNIACTEGVVTK